MMPSTPTSMGSPSCRWYQSINTLPLNRFIDVLVDKNYSALIISGYPSQLELQLSWSEIQSEFNDLIGDNESRLYLSLYRDIATLDLTLQQINILVECLRQVYYEPFLQKLNGLLFTSFKLDPDQPEQYQKTLDGCINRSKAYKIDRDLKAIQFKAIEEKHASHDGKDYTRQYFLSVLITLSNHAKYQISADAITVFEYGTRLIQFNKYCEEVNKTHRR